jgi:outer membrane immunogenic protein
MKGKLLSTLAVMVLSVGSTLAADMPVRKAAPVMAPAAPFYSWTGCYVGGGGGYGMWQQENRYFDVPSGDPIARVDNGGRGWFGTVQVGCDYQIGSRWVIGAFADYDFADIKGDLTANAGMIGNVFGQEKLKHAWAAGGRVGYVIFPQLLTYVSVGYTEAHFGVVNFSSTLTGALTPLTLPSITYDGWFVGTGYEYAIGFLPGVFWKTEYRFSDYGSETRPFVFGGVITDTAASANKYVQTVRSELVWRWNWGRY